MDVARPRSLRHKLLSLALPLVLLLSLAAALVINEWSARERADLETQRQAHLADFFAQLLAEPLSRGDRPAIDVLVHRMLGIDGVVSATVSDPANVPLAQGRRALPAQMRPDGPVVLRQVVLEPSQMQRVAIGQLKVHFMAGPGSATGGGELGQNMLVIATSMLLALALAAWMYRRWIQAPLDRLHAAIRDSADAGHFVRVKDPTDDDIGVVMRAFNDMQSRADRRARELDQLYHQTPGLLFSLDQEARLVSVSDKFCVTLGHAREHLLGQSFLDLTQRPSAELQDKLIASLTEQEPLAGFQVSIACADGKVMVALLNTFTLTDTESGHSVCLLNDITRQIEHLEALTRQANIDQVTGLPNRFLLKDRLAMALYAAARQRSMAAVIFLDLDRFRVVNETLGHRLADGVLLEVAQRLQAQSRAMDTAGRLDADEFALVLNGVNSRAEGLAIVQRLSACIKEPIELDGRHVLVSASIGLALFPEDGADPDELLLHAETAMFRAKLLGRDRFCCFEAPVVCDDERTSTEPRAPAPQAEQASAQASPKLSAHLIAQEALDKALREA